MPYKSTKEVKDKVNGADKLSERKLRQFMHVFNSCNEGGGDEGTCHAQAWSVVNKTAMVDPEQLEIGIGVEMEHTDNPEIAKQIALDHLSEIPDYYYHLLKMEKEVEEDNLHKQVASELNKIAKLIESVGNGDRDLVYTVDMGAVKRYDNEKDYISLVKNIVAKGKGLVQILNEKRGLAEIYSNGRSPFSSDLVTVPTKALKEVERMGY